MTTKIEWASDTWNPVVGCRPVSAGCLNCYAASMATRLEGMGTEGYRRTAGGLRIAERRPGRPATFTGSVRTLPRVLEKPLGWRKPRRIFVCSMNDLFYGDDADRRAAERAGIPFQPVPETFIDRVFAVASLCPQHTFQILTKRPARMAEYLTEEHTPGRIWTEAESMREGQGVTRWPLPNVILGTSVESDDEPVTRRMLHLADCPAAGYFVSLEPMLGWPSPALRAHLTVLACHAGGRLGENAGEPRGHRVQAIIGGESGPGARPCHLDWIRMAVAQAAAAGARVFVKQLGSKPIANRWDLERWSAWPGNEHIGKLGLGMDRDGDLPAVLRDSKGGDMGEWPQELRIREQIDLRR